MNRWIFYAVILLGAYLVWKVANVKLKAGASLENVSWRMFWAAIVAEGIYKAEGSEATITSGGDGKHSATSKHYAENNESGMVEALDFRTWGVDPEIIATKLRKRLGNDYDVVIEPTHIHVEYDPA